MLRLEVGATELWDEGTESFSCVEGRELRLEHSLLSVSKWEAIWGKPFLTREPKTQEETISYVRCMLLDADVPDSAIELLSDGDLRSINDYIAAPMTATTFSQRDQGPSREKVTSELIYYWMVVHGIPFECQEWHLNRLLTLIRVCNVKSQPARKMSRSEIRSRNRALNESRRKALGSKG